MKKRAPGITSSQPELMPLPKDFQWTQVPEEATVVGWGACSAEPNKSDRVVASVDNRLYPSDTGSPELIKALQKFLPKFVLANLKSG